MRLVANVLTVSVILALLLSGCVTMETKVYSNGRIRRTIVVDAPAKYASAAREVVVSKIGPHWRETTRDEGAKHLLVFERDFSAYDEVRPFPSITFHRELSWLLPVAKYEYSEKISLQDEFAAPSEKAEAEKINLTFVLSMPGRLVNDDTSTDSIRQALLPVLTHSTATWTAMLGSSIDVHAKSWEIRFWWLLFELAIIAGLVVLVRKLTKRFRRQPASHI